MHAFGSKRNAIIFAATVMLLGTQPLSAECVSATVAEQVYYSCSGVLTVMPKDNEEPDDGSAPDGAVSSDAGSKIPNPFPETGEQRPEAKDR